MPDKNQADLSAWQAAQHQEQDFWRSYLVDELRCPSRDFAVGNRYMETWWQLNALGYGWVVERHLWKSNPLAPGTRWCDVGGGPISMLEATGADVVSIDPSYAAYHAAMPHLVIAPGKRALFGARGGCEYRSCLVQDMPEVGVFDGVWCCNVLDHAADWADMLAHCYRILRPGGLLLLATDVRNFTDRYHIGVFTAKELLDRLAAVGFSVTCSIFQGNEDGALFRLNVVATRPE